MTLEGTRRNLWRTKHGRVQWTFGVYFNQLSLSGPMVSDNGCLMLFIGGFKAAIEKHGDEIINFLKG